MGGDEFFQPHYVFSNNIRGGQVISCIEQL